MAQAGPAAPRAVRVLWIDGVKGISILWIAYFHLFLTYTNKRFPWGLDKHYFASFIARCAPESAVGFFGCVAKGIFVAFSQFGFHAVGVFLVMSGFGLTYSLAKTGEPEAGWTGWYRARVLRLFPMYWVAHVIYLVLPFQARLEPLDYRFILSFLGDRVYPPEIIHYFNAALWYFGLILGLYLLFPFLFRLLQRIGPTWFLIFCGFETLASRYLLLAVFPMAGYHLQGASFLGRLWEFAFGMVIGMQFRRRSAAVETFLFSWSTLLAGIAIYTLGLYSYGSLLTYTATDALIGTGLFVILAHVARAFSELGRAEAAIAYVGSYSYGLYLIHQPYVIYFGARVRALGMPAFLVFACVLITILTLAAIPLERYVNQITNRTLGRGAKSIAPRSQIS